MMTDQELLEREQLARVFDTLLSLVTILVEQQPQRAVDRPGSIDPASVRWGGRLVRPSRPGPSQAA